MKLVEVDDAIRVCKEHLVNSHANGTEIESYLTQYLVVRIYAAFEERVKSIVLDCVSKRTKDPFVYAFVQSCLGLVSRSITTSEISKLLKKFGTEYQDKFRDKVEGTKAETFFNSIVSRRHETAHLEKGSSLTFNELERFYEEGHVILDSLNEVLSS